MRAVGASIRLADYGPPHRYACSVQSFEDRYGFLDVWEKEISSEHWITLFCHFAFVLKAYMKTGV